MRTVLRPWFCDKIHVRIMTVRLFVLRLVPAATAAKWNESTSPPPAFTVKNI